MPKDESEIQPCEEVRPIPANQALTENVESLLSAPHTINTKGYIRKPVIPRVDVAQAMNSEMFLCNIKHFLTDYSPCGKEVVKPEDIQWCRTYLVEANLLRKSGKVWKDFPIRPSRTKLKDNAAYDQFASLVTGIWKFSELKGKKMNKYMFKMVPGNHLTSSSHGTNHKMDACTFEEEYESKLCQDNIIMPVEIKPVYSFDNQKEVHEQIVGDCHHILCDDPRRMFIYGVSIVDERMSIWYFSRTHSVKAIAFDWIKDIDTFIHVMLAFAFATPTDLGIDPFVHKVKRVSQRDDQHFVYEFNDPAQNVRETRSSISDPRKIYYRTVQARFFGRPLCLSGRITRIWEVIQVHSVKDPSPVEGAVPVILKDVWLDATKKTEGENQNDIFTAVDKFVAEGLRAHSGPGAMMSFINSEPRFAEFDSATKTRLAGLLTGQKYKTLFLTKIIESVGNSSKKLSEHATRPITPLFTTWYERRHERKSNRTVQGSAAPNGSSVEHCAPIRQVRFVYKEVCQDLSQVVKLGDVMDILRQALDALQILYCAGWVHRDISMGNILAHRVEASPNAPIWKVKLSDLEFAQPLGFPKHKTDSRIGTPYYMAVEIMNKRYLVDKLRKVPKPRAPENNDNLAFALSVDKEDKDYKHYKQFRIPTYIKSVPVDATPGLPLRNDPVSHNYQHDLESIWWIMVYLVTSRVGYEPSEEFVTKVFVESAFADVARSYFLTTPLDDIYDIFHPNIVDTFHALLETLREEMYETYVTRAVFGHLLAHKSYSAIHAKFATLVDEALLNNAQNWRAFELAKEPVDGPEYDSHLPLTVGSKRPLPDNDAVSNKRSKV